MSRQFTVFLLLLVFFFFFFFFVRSFSVFLLIRGSYALSFAYFSSFTITISHLRVDRDTHSHTQATQIYIFHIALNFEHLLVICSSRVLLPLFLLLIIVFESMLLIFRIQWNDFHFNENECENEWIRKSTRALVVSYRCVYRPCVSVYMVSFSCRQSRGDFVIWCVHTEHA